MQRPTTGKFLVRAALSALLLSTLPMRGQNPPQQTNAQITEAKTKLEALDQDIIVITQKIPKKDKTQETAPRPPSKDKVLMDEARERLEWLKATRDQLQERINHAETAKNPAEAMVYAKDALLKADSAETLKRSIVGPPPAEAPAAAVATGASSNSGSRIQFHSGALQQLMQSNEFAQQAVETKSPDRAAERSKQAFGEGRAGAGGVALYKPARMLTPLDPTKITGAVIENGRLILVYDGRRLLFPEFDPQFLTVALRSVYGGEGLVKGTLLANEENAVVLRTGPDRYGDVAWKKEFLPDLPKELTLGQELSLDLGPGVGVLSLPKPSYDRVTYYGPLKGNLMGQVVQQSDMVFSMFWYGVDWRTGRPMEPDKFPGFVTNIERQLALPAMPKEEPARKTEKAKNWWEETVWFVWTPGEMDLQLSADGKEFEFAKATMKVTVWSVREENVRADSQAQGEFITAHYDDFARAIPVLGQLKEAAKTVAAVRWLKQNHVPLDIGWAKANTLTRVKTPEEIQRYSVYVQRDKSGRPEVETAKEGSSR
jgi:hypothetical protein